MLTIFKNGVPGLTPMAEPISGCWINTINPGVEEISRLEALGIPHDFITYPLDLDERARTEYEEGIRLIIVRVPYYQGTTSDIPYATIPLGIVLTDQYVVTIAKLDNAVLQDFTGGKARGLSTAKRNRFVLRLLLAVSNLYLQYLREINKAVDNLEDRLQATQHNKELLELLKYQKSLTYLMTALKSNELAIKRLQRSQMFSTYPDDEDLLEDVLTENEQAMEMTSITTNILSSTMDAFASIISNNLNVVMKFLASMTIVISIPTLVASLFGMNVNLPLGGHDLGFLFVLGLILLMTVPVVVIFMKRDWF
jgi:magnesium transporter